MWQVFLKIRDYDSCRIDVPQEGEVFETEEAADARAEELDSTRAVFPDFFFVKKI
jgi:hypothetical protein